MNKFEAELGNWAAIVKKYASESSQISQKLRKILKKHNSADEIEDFIQVFGKSAIYYLS